MPRATQTSLKSSLIRHVSFALWGRRAFRHWSGRWPSPDEKQQFAAAWRADTEDGLPPIPRALIATRAADAQLERMLFARLIREGHLADFARRGPTAQAGNPLAFWQGRPVGFLHFEKAGGSALAAALSRHFHPLQIATHANAKACGLEGPGDWPPADPARLRRATLFWGHFGFRQFAVLPPERLLLCMLREPRARIVSLYQFWRSIHPELLPTLGDERVALAHGSSFLDFLRADSPGLRDSIDNVYTRRLADLYGAGSAPDPLRADPGRGLAQALAALSEFAWIGVTERFDAAMESLSSLLGITLSHAAADANRRENNPADWPLLYRPVPELVIGPEEGKALDHLTEFDSTVYAAALSRASG